MSKSWTFADRTKNMGASIIREILKVSSRPGVTSFAGGLPAPTSFPVKEFEKALKETMRTDSTRALQYMVTEGHYGLKSYICNWLKKQEINEKPERMLLTQGSQQALDFLGKIFFNPGDAVLMEDPTYLGAIQAFKPYEPEFVTVPIDEKGMRPEALEKALARRHVKFIYVVPTFQNPSGVTMSLERRRALLEIAKKKRIPIIEDDPYGLLRFKGKWVPSLYSLAKGQGVIYLSTFSKSLSPGIRLGYVLADAPIIRQLVFAKQAADLQTNSFIQCVVYNYCRMGFFEKHIPAIIKDYAHRANVMLSSIHEHFPPEVKFIEPEGGMFIWCTLPEGVKSSAVFKAAIKQKVAFVDGSVFYANGGGENTMRLNFTNSSDEAIRAGIKRLGAVIRSFL